ncbi:MAG: hypothetical protein AAF998_24570 [Bacteroidota bacterium]
MVPLLLSAKQAAEAYVSGVTLGPFYPGGNHSGIGTIQMTAEGAELALDILGSSEIPILATFADLGAAALALGRGDEVGAGLSLLAAIPLVGAAFNGAKWAKRFGRLVSKGGQLVEYAGEAVPVFRGGPSFKLKPNEYKINKKTGMVKPTHGVSLDVDPNTVEKFGGAYKIEPIPDGLEIIQRGQRSEHFEIVPSKEISVQSFQKLLDQITVSKVD